MSSKHCLVLGATGPTGIDFCNAAVRDGYKLTIYARNLSKLPEEISKHEAVTTVEGSFDDEEKLRMIADCKAEVFVSFAGPVQSSKGTPVTDCYEFLVPLLQKSGTFKRALVLSTPSYTSPEDKGGYKWTFSVFLIKMINKDAYREVTGIGKYMASLPTEVDEGGIAWTLFRVGWLGNGDAKPVKATYTGSGEDGLAITRKSIAEWVLDEIHEGRYIGKAPLLSN